MVQRINYESLPEVPGPYVHAAKHNDTLYVSGLTAFGTPAQSGTLLEQSQEVLAQLNTILMHEKRSRSDLIKLTIFVRDISKQRSVRDLLADFHQGYLPACSLVEVSHLFDSDLLIEIEATIALQS
ncbi:RidA family protein [Vibrio renipiscarius]|uniref:Endoribonuclease L-PSP n=1 Tax=Vibrio renipiscarius TaxID=1461322 RepID=A0A0C2N809_9VIBR|nr:RidA family protein [Vibrio renipiscarius]KII75771.1 endoribonuclease L-PSP [Vibrio renipiscarius]KII81779.1 endoribonuclease L-PSP [Vibrio renipiscarius]